MKLWLSAISTVNASFAEDVEAYAAAGFDAIGLWEIKLPEDDAANVALLARARSRRRELHPDRPVVPPARDPRDGRPAGPRGAGRRDLRVDSRVSPRTTRSASSASAGRWATAPRPKAATIVDRRPHQAAAAAREAGVRLGFEPIHPLSATTAGFVAPSADALAVLDEAGARTMSGSWPTPTTSRMRRPATSRRSPVASPASTSPTALERATRRPRAARRAARVGRRSSWPRSARAAGTGRSTSRSSRRPRRSGRCRRTKPPARRTRAPRRC